MNYHITEALESTVPKATLDDMVRDALHKLAKHRIEFDDDNSIFWCRFVMDNGHVVLFTYFIHPDTKEPKVYLLLWQEVVRVGLADKLAIGAVPEDITRVFNREIH
jgi:hypothetical protein